MALNKNQEVFTSSSSTDFQVVRLKHTWTVNHFSLSCEQTGQCLYSPTFTAGTNSEQSEWSLMLYPKGQSRKCNKYVGLYLLLKKCKGRGIYATYNFSILNAKGNVVNILNASKRFMASGDGWGWPEFVEQSFLYNQINKCLLDDKLTIVCEITAKIGGKTK